MKKHNFVIMRYSLLTKEGVEWQIGRQEFDNYKEQLFNASRLAQHEFLFENVTLPSLVNQTIEPTADNFTLLVLTSELLPEKSLKKLEDLLRPYPWAKVISLPPYDTVDNIILDCFTEELKRFNHDLTYSTTRLDDDDGLSVHFIERLNQYVDPQFEGYCVTFPNGFSALYDDRLQKYISIHKHYAPKIALGLSYINTYDSVTKNTGNEIPTIYHNGVHSKVDFVSPTIMDSKYPTFLRTVHSASDSNNANQVKKIKSLPVSKTEDIEEVFPLHAGLFTSSETLSTYLSTPTKVSKKENELKPTQRLENEMKNLKNEISVLYKENENLKDEVKELVKQKKMFKDKYMNIQESRIWRYTKPIREAGITVKRLIRNK
ncbi:glycosyltransferase [Thalassorhabdus alkalitolerans]|uniref:Glycosyltransferase n=1 Tax=Thalassorhabdus alkalitolerans TaxID=2282697 RepID=A0ABW0YLE0_9BACI